VGRADKPRYFVEVTLIRASIPWLLPAPQLPFRILTQLIKVFQSNTFIQAFSLPWYGFCHTLLLHIQQHIFRLPGASLIWIKRGEREHSKCDASGPTWKARRVSSERAVLAEESHGRGRPVEIVFLSGHERFQRLLHDTGVGNTGLYGAIYTVRAVQRTYGDAESTLCRVGDKVPTQSRQTGYKFCRDIMDRPSVDRVRFIEGRKQAAFKSASFCLKEELMNHKGKTVRGIGKAPMMQSCEGAAPCCWTGTARVLRAAQKTVSARGQGTAYRDRHPQGAHA